MVRIKRKRSMKQNMTKHPPRTTLKNIKVSLRKQERPSKKHKIRVNSWKANSNGSYANLIYH